jgi:two-component system nitrogen regulation sensor histidine kinase NtrY
MKKALTRGVALFRQLKISRFFAIGLVVMSLTFGVATYISLTDSTPFGPGPDHILVLINTDLVLLLLLGVVIANHLTRLWAERRHVGSKLHMKLVGVFSLLAATPAVIMVVFSALFFNFGIESWFSERVRTTLNESIAVAEGYLKEHKKVIRGDVQAMAYDLIRDGKVLLENNEVFNDVVTQQAAARLLTEAIVFDNRSRVIAKSPLTFALELERIKPEDLQKAQAGGVVIQTNEGGNRVRALAYMDYPLNAYLYVGRLVDGDVLNHMTKTQESVAEYNLMEDRRSSLQITFSLIFIVVALLLLLVAIWIGLVFATKLAKSIQTLIIAAERIRKGDLHTRVDETEAGEELTLLSRAFNRMTGQLQTQQQDLMLANQQLDQRRHFTESILDGVSAGVIALNVKKSITLSNQFVTQLLGLAGKDLEGKHILEVIPELKELLDQAKERPDRFLESQVTVPRGGVIRTLFVRLVVERSKKRIGGYIVTLDDITELVSAQRKAAWADVARRIAHEIKNPLTPIQLSAERLKRKYLKEIHSDPDTFLNCTNTIIRQVGDIGRMVDEFSHFARMPVPVFKKEDLGYICQQAVFLQRTANPSIQFEFSCKEEGLEAWCDSRLIGQALTNLLKNSIDAIEGRDRHQGELTPGYIGVRLFQEGDYGVIQVQDNGKGLPSEGKERLTEPYVTTRLKGTGLGLAIVKKIMEDHQGELQLKDRMGGGALIQLRFPLQEGSSPLIS